MSEEFLQFRMPCETCIVKAMCKDKHYKSDIKLNKSTGYCLGLPDWDAKEKIYIKGLMECWINVGVDISQQLMRIKSDNKKITDDRKHTSIPDQYLDFLFVVINSIQWVIHSTSWNKGELYEFDSFEIKEKLKYITYWLEGGK